MAAKSSNKDKEQASNLKSDGVARGTTRCPLCHKVLGGHRRNGEGNKKGFSDYDFGGALFAHFPQCGKRS